MVTRMVTRPAASVDNPVLVSVNQLRGVTSWQIPFIDQELVCVSVCVCACVHVDVCLHTCMYMCSVCVHVILVQLQWHTL